MTDSSIGQIIKNLRKQAGVTQEQLANKSGLSYSTIAKIERGAINDPSFSTILAITKGLGVSITQFVESFADMSGVDIKPTNSPITFVYCDVNGVLVRFFQRGFVSLAEKIHRDVNQVETAFWHYNAAVNKGEMTMNQFNAAVAKRLRVDTIDWQNEYMQAIETVEAMHKCLIDISSTTSIGLLTNISPGFLPEMRKKGLVPDINYASIVDSSEVDAIKPEPEIYIIAEKMAGKSGAEILFIDDSRTNLMEAEKLGWQVLWFDDYRPEESVKRIKATLSPTR